MTYFNPAIYNKENLRKNDRKQLEYCEQVFKNVIMNTKADFDASEFGGNSNTMKQIVNEIVESFCNELRVNLGYELQENVVGIIDNYGEDEAPEREVYTTFLYNIFDH